MLFPVQKLKKDKGQTDSRIHKTNTGLLSGRSKGDWGGAGSGGGSGGLWCKHGRNPLTGQAWSSRVVEESWHPGCWQLWGAGGHEARSPGHRGLPKVGGKPSSESRP